MALLTFQAVALLLPSGGAPRTSCLRCSVEAPVQTVIEAPPIQQAFELPQPVRGGLAAASASAATWAGQHMLGLGAVPAASLIGLVGGVALPTPAWRLPMFAGTFVGMSSTALIGGLPRSVVIGALAGGIVLPLLLDGRKVCVGRGGRLGFAATLSSIVSYCMTSFGSPGAASGACSAAVLLGPLARPLLAPSLVVLAGSIVGALATKGWMDLVPRASTALAGRVGNSVSASSMIGLLSCFSPAAWRAPIFIGSFVAMSAPTVLPSYRHLAGAGAFAGAAHALLGTSLLAGGFGGRLGTSALIGVVGYERLLAAVTAAAAPKTEAAGPGSAGATTTLPMTSEMMGSVKPTKSVFRTVAQGLGGGKAKAEAMAPSGFEWGATY